MPEPQETSRAKHTEGPWVVQDETVIWTALHDPVETTYDIGTPIADVRRLKSFGGPAYDDREVVANARLIAAAPEMLEALRYLCAEVGGLRAFEGGLRAEIGNSNWSVLMLRLEQADALIAKATGA